MPSVDNAHALAPRTSETRICTTCNAAMTLIGRLPGMSLRPAVQVFRCFSCNSVVSTESGPAAEPALRMTTVF